MSSDIQSALDRIATAVEKMAKDEKSSQKLILQSCESPEARHTREYREGLVTREFILTNGEKIHITVDEERDLIASELLKPEAKWQSAMNQVKNMESVLKAMSSMPKKVDGEVLDG
jgi:hypothetical protein